MTIQQNFFVIIIITSITYNSYPNAKQHYNANGKLDGDGDDAIMRATNNSIMVLTRNEGIPYMHIKISPIAFSKSNFFPIQSLSFQTPY